MNKPDCITAIALRDLNCLYADTSSKRNLIQRKMYLAQYLGIPLGYGYSWYVHGPYSPDLARDSYRIITEIGSIDKDLKFEDEFSKIISAVNAIEDNLSNPLLKGINIVDWYTLIVDIAYLFKHDFNTEKEITNQVRNFTSKFNDKQIKLGCLTFTDLKQSF